MSTIFATRTLNRFATGGIRSRCNSQLNDQIRFKQIVQRAKLSSIPKKKPPNENLVVASYCVALTTFILGVSYASVPLYKVFCSMTGMDTNLP